MELKTLSNGMSITIMWACKESLPSSGKYLTITTDFLLIGGGIIGISIARELKSRCPDSSVCILEKEPQCGLHASGRNSGVLHAGFYYTADSFKAKFTREGNQRLTEYCDAKNIKLNKCGKLVVAQNESELVWLDELMKRASKNGVPLESVTSEKSYLKKNRSILQSSISSYSSRQS